MSEQPETKYFHISDILSLTTGYPFSKMDAMEMPDGAVRESYETPMDGVIELVSFLTGVDLVDPSDPEKYDVFAMQYASNYAEQDLYLQFPAFASVQFPQDELEDLDGHAEKLTFIADWIESIGLSMDTEWFEIQAPSEERKVQVRREVDAFLNPAAATPAPGFVLN